MEKITGVRGLDQALWRRLRVYAVRLGETMGTVLTRAIREFLERVGG